jgi:hypothetical protein
VEPFRWISAALPHWPFVALVWCGSLVLAASSLRSTARARVPFVEMLLRVPAALFFFVLLALDARRDPALIAWALAFAPPYCSLLDIPRR